MTRQADARIRHRQHRVLFGKNGAQGFVKADGLFACETFRILGRPCASRPNPMTRG
jgi:hypothetical protein